ncbi:MoaD/ThiS family protein [Allopusillimonas soli]|uniref:Sulfur carrier protein ThiS n=1 Tax=Allopusillimonas soli TaxID=659016 RepID=A0A853FKF3_9BURK|nr:sulfur carrier protein ThiS [Allopusillimonas soli]NYT38406.1 sulfur carrier protein ThiS [Allopusillimonas soli]TEA72032.1 MoaD/ThiS family protein [Allopusillimonas soli]
MTTIQIFLNGQAHHIAQGLTLAQALEQLLDAADTALPYASAVNGEHVARQVRQNVILNDQDSITTFEPITGG